ncbi:GTPase Era, mitochondrial [Caerostris darwini]|uniref:GTPase Era, mitochondrial n=1 Tax=Caerostris darwini TaxID=1538125 RepID=A0AAV4RJS7_9ARAC|nr:GTPase Era, mitochondrial [Caerostris darwini]
MVFSKINRSTFLLIRESQILCGHFNRFASTSMTSVNDGEYHSKIDLKSSNPIHVNKKIPVAIDEFERIKSLKPCQPENPHLLKVSILGEPNVGKSTLTNKLVKWKVCAVSRKVHTTRRKASAIFVEDNKQIVFLDTPGFVSPELSKKHNLEASFVMDPVRSIMDADIIAVVVDISNKWINNRINQDVLQLLQDYKEKKSILILNKIDAMKSKSRMPSLLKILTNNTADDILYSSIQLNNSEDNISNKKTEDTKENPENIARSKSSVLKETGKGWPLFSKVFTVSALKNIGIDDLRNYLLNEALPKEWMYHDCVVTDQHPHALAITILREKLLEYLPEEIPYILDLQIYKWNILNTGSPEIGIKIKCHNSRHKRFVIGPAGKHISLCVEKYRNALKEAFKKDILVHINVE